MTLQKNPNMPGWYECFGYVNGVLLVATGEGRLAALNSMFEKMRWAFPNQ